jgi:hypothetical protein
MYADSERLLSNEGFTVDGLYDRLEIVNLHFRTLDLALPGSFRLKDGLYGLPRASAAYRPTTAKSVSSSKGFSRISRSDSV